MLERDTPRIKAASVAAARALLADRQALERAVVGISVGPGYEGDWDIDWDDVRAGLRSVADRVPQVAKILEEEFFGQLFCRIDSTETDEAGPFDDGDDDDYWWGNQREVTADDLAHGLRTTIEVVEREQHRLNAVG